MFGHIYPNMHTCDIDFLNWEMLLSYEELSHVYSISPFMLHYQYLELYSHVIFVVQLLCKSLNDSEDFSQFQTYGAIFSV